MLEPDFENEPSLGAQRDVYSVSRLNREVRGLLEGSFPLLWVEGEISNFSRPSSGHWYFSLKDEQAQVRCAMFRNRNSLVRAKPENGMQVLVRARISLYEGRGEYQLIVEHLEEAGDGALRRAFEELKQKLAQEGLFDAEHKIDIPTLPRRIGVITSPTGAAVRDILSVLRRRFPAIPVLIYPVPVQGNEAAADIARTLQLADARGDCDVLILARGGGSLEDLWAFNEEGVARAIYACRLPVVTGIGHEVDFTIADFVADHRAPTPSAAAELLSPDQADLHALLTHRQQALHKRVQQKLRHHQELLRQIGTRLQQQHPGVRVRQWSQRIDELDLRLQRAQQQHVARCLALVQQQHSRLLGFTPAHALRKLQERMGHLQVRLQRAVHQQLNTQQHRLQQTVRALDTISPLATLHRGYTILQQEDGSIVRDSTQVRVQEELHARLGKGGLRLKVQKIEPGEDKA